MNSLLLKIEKMKHSPRFKKWFWLTVKLVIALILIAILIRALVYGWVLYVEFRGTMATNDMEEYVSKQYVSHPDGTLAAEYLPSYEELTDYEWVDYYYFDASLARKLFGQYGDSFVVDVKYGEDVYEAKKHAVFSHYTFSGRYLMKRAISPPRIPHSLTKMAIRGILKSRNRFHPFRTLFCTMEVFSQREAQTA